MTVQAYTTSSYATDNSTTEFAFTFEVFATSEVVVTLRVDSTGAETVLAETTDYTVALTGSDPATGGAITTVATHDTGRTLTISRAGTETQETDLIAGGEIPADTVEDQFDKLVMLVQEHTDILDRCFKVPITDAPAESYSVGYAELDDSINRASTFFTFDSTGLPTLASSVLDITTVTTTFTESLLDDADSAAFQTTLGFSADVQSLLDDANLAAMQTTLGITTITVLNEDDMGAGSGSEVSPPSQDSVYEFVVTTAATMANKTLTAPVLNSPVLAGTISGNAFLDEDNMASDSATKLASQQSIKAYADSVVPATPKYAAYSYTVAQNASGGTATTGSWGTRPIDDEDIDDDSIGAVSSNQITLDAGTYYFTCHASFFKSNETRLRVRNTTAGTTLSVSTQAFFTSGDLDSKPLSFSGRFTVAASQVLEVQYYCKRTQATNGLGYPMNIASETERYLTIEFWEVP